MDMSTNCEPKRVIGYWMSEKKSQKLNWSEFSKVCRKHGYELVKLNLNTCLEDQGPFTVIIHKLTDIIGTALKNDLKAMRMLHHVESYIKSNPDVVIIDPFDNVRKLLDRYRTYRVIHDSDLHKIDVFTPPFVDLTSNDPSVNLETLKRSGVCFPFVCKPLVASGTDRHKMAIVFNEKGLKDCTPPCVAHSFVNHNAVLYKLFIVGHEYYICERPSLKNFYPDPDRKTIHFDSHDVSKPDSSSSLSVMDDVELSEQNHNVDPEKWTQIVYTLREELGMNLFGVDVVVENTTGRHAIIDINVYPSYDGYPDFFESLMRCIKNCVEQKRHVTIFPEQEQEDSGFETADSSDEKKRRTSPPMLGSKIYERRL